MDEKELRKALEIHLDTLRRNLEVVSLEVLKTKYQKPYEELRGQICKAATEYTRHVAHVIFVSGAACLTRPKPTLMQRFSKHSA